MISVADIILHGINGQRPVGGVKLQIARFFAVAEHGMKQTHEQGVLEIDKVQTLPHRGNCAHTVGHRRHLIKHKTPTAGKLAGNMLRTLKERNIPPKRRAPHHHAGIGRILEKPAKQPVCNARDRPKLRGDKTRDLFYGRPKSILSVHRPEL